MAGSAFSASSIKTFYPSGDNPATDSASRLMCTTQCVCYDVSPAIVGVGVTFRLKGGKMSVYLLQDCLHYVTVGLVCASYRTYEIKMF